MRSDVTRHDYRYRLDLRAQPKHQVGALRSKCLGCARRGLQKEGWGGGADVVGLCGADAVEAACGSEVDVAFGVEGGAIDSSRQLGTEFVTTDSKKSFQESMDLPPKSHSLYTRPSGKPSAFSRAPGSPPAFCNRSSAAAFGITKDVPSFCAGPNSSRLDLSIVLDAALSNLAKCALISFLRHVGGCIGSASLWNCSDFLDLGRAQAIPCSAA